MKVTIVLSFFFLASFAFAESAIEGAWKVQDGSKVIRIHTYADKVTFNTRSYYSNGAPSDYFFEFKIPNASRITPGTILQGRLRSLDGYYGCIFDEPAEMQLVDEESWKIHYPLLTFHRVTRSVRDGRPGRHYRRVIDWNGWGWVERYYSFPVERWRVVSSECVIDQRNWRTEVITRF